VSLYAWYVRRLLLCYITLPCCLSARDCTFLYTKCIGCQPSSQTTVDSMQKSEPTYLSKNSHILTTDYKSHCVLQRSKQSDRYQRSFNYQLPILSLIVAYPNRVCQLTPQAMPSLSRALIPTLHCEIKIMGSQSGINLF
jgi:hypothetical protein